MKQTRGLVLVVLLAILAVTACSGSQDGANGSASIVLEDFRFTPNRIDARVGVPLTVQLTNRGTERHDLNFESLHMPGLGGVEAILQPGETRTITLTFDQPGTHTFICTLPGHAAAGMTGAAYVTL
jgi:plastocyanin